MTEQIIQYAKEMQGKLEPKLERELLFFDRTKYYNPVTNEMVSGVEHNKYNICWLDTHNDVDLKRVYGSYYEYIDSLKCVVCMLCSISTIITHSEKPKKWRVDDYFFITNKKELIAYVDDEWQVFTENISSYITFPLTLQSIDAIRSYYGLAKSTANANMYKAFSQIFPVVKLDGTTTVKLDCPDHLIRFLNRKETKKTNGPKQKLIDELTAINIPMPKYEDIEIEKTDALIRNKTTNHLARFIFTDITKVKENTCCLRWLMLDDDKKELNEIIRMYVDGKNTIACKQNAFGEYIQFRLSSGKQNFISCRILPFDKEILKGTTLQYFGEIFDDIEKSKQTLYIWTFLQYPIFEKLYKVGFKNLVSLSLSSWAANPTDTLMRSVGAIDKKASNIYKVLGINKYQASKIINEKLDILYEIKKSLNADAIDSIDNATFDAVLKMLTTSNPTFRYTIPDICSQIVKLYSSKTLVSLSDKIIDLSNKSKYGYYSNNNYISNYKDYLLMVEKLNDTKNYKATFTDEEQVIKMHDAVVIVYNLQKEKYKLDAFNTHIEKFQKFVYDDDENFCVIAPKEPGEIAVEGITLHHCVKSYIDRVITGSTNILFIRKVTEPTKPFFTVEVSNSGNIEQVHGFANRNADTEEGMVEFVKKWAKAKKLKCNNFNKVR